MFCAPGAHIRSLSNKDDIAVTVMSRPLYQILFLRNDRHQSVMVDEVEELDFNIIKEHLERGESVFITTRADQRQETSTNSM